MRVSKNNLNPILKRQVEKTLLQLLADLNKPIEAENFINDFFNKSEIETYSKRLGIAYYLKKGRSYENIKNNLKVSSATIASVEKLMDKPGIKLALKKIEADEWANIWSERIKKVVR